MVKKTKVLIDRNKIESKIKELAQKITEDYQDSKGLVVVCVLKGASIFFADLVRQIDLPMVNDFLSLSSYGNNTTSSGEITVRKDIDVDVRNKDVLIVEDVVDSGGSLYYLKGYFDGLQPSSVRICTLLRKDITSNRDIKVDYIGFVIPELFVAGYGMDYAEQFRNLPDIIVLE